jgi:hypothetical protein
LLYNNGRLIIKSLDGSYLCIMCVQRINIPLLNLTANVAAQKLGKMVKQLERIALFRSIH